jgi:hypothetical protein
MVFGKRPIVTVLASVAMLVAIGGRCAAAKDAVRTLENDLIRAEFDENGLTAIHDNATGSDIRFEDEGFSVTIDGSVLDSDQMGQTFLVPGKTSMGCEFSTNDQKWTVAVTYTLPQGRAYLTKDLVVNPAWPRGRDRRIEGFNPPPPPKTTRIEHVDVLRCKLVSDFPFVQRIRSGAFLRQADKDRAQTAKVGLFFAIDNPFIDEQKDGHISVSYNPDMDWPQGGIGFHSDTAFIGVYHPMGNLYRRDMVPEWRYVAGPPPPGPALDWAEIDAITQCEQTRITDRHEKSNRVHVGWCENDYQIDVSTPDGRAEYKRIIDRAAEVGCRDVLFAPSNSGVSSLAENTDAWGWENLLWLGLGQKVRKGQFEPGKGELPASVREMLDYAKSKDVKLLAYVYPSLPFMQDPAWTAWIAKANEKPGGYLGADTGNPGFQDWFVNQLVAFQQQTGIGGYSFDHWWIAYDRASSKYAQWDGCRHVLEELRQRVPDIVIDGRQQYQQFGAWTWLAGSYPHPTGTDEQPQSFRAFPDLHIDRVSADRQRYAAWWYRIENFCPPELMPGFITHQTPRIDAKGQMRRDRFRAADWDYLGWRYSLISSIATAPFNHVVNMLPARDPEEYAAFGESDRKYLRDWLDWTDQNADVLRNVRPIVNQPMLGHTDGTAAFKGDHGFVFLFNPNYRAMPADFTLDSSVGLVAAKADEWFEIRQLYPDAEKGRLIFDRHPFWKAGETVSIELAGTDAMVLEVTPAPAPASITQPVLFGAVGTAEIRGAGLVLTGVKGEVGTSRQVPVLMPTGTGEHVSTVSVNGKPIDIFERHDTSITLGLDFAGYPMRHCPQIGRYDPKFAGGVLKRDVLIPKRIFDQLAERKRRWPVHYTDDDLRATWLGPDRLLLFVDVADPDDKMQVALKIDDKQIPLAAAYSSIFANATERTFVGWYADVSALAPDVKHSVELTLPKLEAGRFQGLFLDNIETEYTDEVIATQTPK